MNVRQAVRLALRALRANTLRSALTMLGIVIGVAAVIAMVAVGAGAQARISEQIESLGSNLLLVLPGSRTASGVRFGTGTQILTDSGFATKGALIANIANGAISVLATFVGIWLLGRVNRRPMLLIGLLGTTSSLLLIGVLSLILEPGLTRGFAILSLTVAFLAFQQGAISPVTWLMLAEMVEG